MDGLEVRFMRNPGALAGSYCFEKLTTVPPTKDAHMQRYKIKLEIQFFVQSPLLFAACAGLLLKYLKENEQDAT